MVRPIDVRVQPREVDATRRDELRRAARAVSAALPGAHRIQVESLDPTTGNAAVITSDEAAPESGQYVARALRLSWKL